MSSSKNGFGKFLLLCGAAAAVGAGVYYYFTKKDSELDNDLEDDDFDDFDDFDDDDDINGRGYVNLDHGTSEDKASADEPKSESKTEEFFDDEKKK